MAKIYINYHSDYDYAMAIIDGFVDLREYVFETSWLCWAPSSNGKRQIMISQVKGVPEGEPARLERVDEFVKFVEKLGVEVVARNKRDEEWQSWNDFHLQMVEQWSC